MRAHNTTNKIATVIHRNVIQRVDGVFNTIVHGETAPSSPSSCEGKVEGHLHAIDWWGVLVTKHFTSVAI